MVSSLIALAVALQQPGPQVTVYNGGFGLIKERRTLDLRGGEQTVAVENVAQLIEVNSVAVKRLTGGDFTVLEQNYQYDLISANAILNKAVGSEIILNRVLPDGTKEQVVGTLVSLPTAIVGNPDGSSSVTWNGLVLQTRDGRVLLNPTGEIEVRSIPSGLISKPTLFWTVEAERAGRSEIELSYLTQGMRWNADYVLSLDKEGTTGDVKGWVTLDNQSGASYQNAQLKLLAGQVNRARVPSMPGRGGVGGMEMKADSFMEEAFSEYHLYTLQRPTTINHKETKQVSLLEAEGVKATKQLVIDGAMQFGRIQPSEALHGVGLIRPAFYLEIENTEANKLGMPLPMGNFKVYQEDSTGALQLIGEQAISHTPRNEKVRLALGSSFDVVAERRRTEFRWVTSGTTRTGSVQTFEVEVRNRKETPETVTVIERHWGEFSISNASIEPKRPDSETLEFVVNLGPNEVKTVKYTITHRF